MVDAPGCLKKGALFSMIDVWVSKEGGHYLA